MKPVTVVANIGPALRRLGAGPIIVALVIFSALLLGGCSEPPIPVEVDLAVKQDQDLWKAGVPKFVPQE